MEMAVNLNRGGPGGGVDCIDFRIIFAPSLRHLRKLKRLSENIGSHFHRF
jgi:hypothetical protein